MKSFKQHIVEKLKISKNVNKPFNDFDDKPVGDLMTTISCTLDFVLYFQERTKAENIDFDMNLYFGNGYVECGEKRSLAQSVCKYSETDTFDELYNRIIDGLKEKHFITEKLRINKNSNIEKEYKDKTNRVTYYNAHSYHSTLLEVDNINLFMDYWYHFLEGEDGALKENLDIHWDDIYVDYDAHDVYVLDNSTGDEIARSYDENPRTFYNVYCRIIEYFEKKNV